MQRLRRFVASVFVLLALSARSEPARFIGRLEKGEKVTIVTMGTSLTGGQWAWPVVMREWLDAEWPGQIVLHNLGVGASASERYLKGRSGLDMLPRAIALKPDVVFIEFAVNDAYLPYKISLEASRSNLITMVDGVLAANPKAEIILQTMNSVTDMPVGKHATDRPHVVDYFQMYRDVAKERGLLLIDHYPNWLKIMTENRARFLKLAPDGIHPQLPGYREVMLPELRSRLLAHSRTLGAAGGKPGDTSVERAHIPRNPHSRSKELANNPNYWRGPYVKSSKPDDSPVQWTPESRAAFEAKTDWFHKAKYGVMFHFLSNVSSPKGGWNSEKWNAWVDAVDVEKTAEHAAEVGAGYVILALGQNSQYACAPNPVIDKHWKLVPGQYNATRDLPMDLHKALKKRGIPMMLYIATDHQHKLPRPATMKGPDRYEYWLKAMQWYSDHYGKACVGWWVDGLKDWIPNYVENTHKALRHGNSDTLVGSGCYEYSDFTHGHCTGNWNGHQKKVLPYFGRWDPEYRIQWQAFQYIGSTWGNPGIAHSNAEFVDYARKIVEGGGVITFDLDAGRRSPGPILFIADDQRAQLRLIRDALKDVPSTDGAAMCQSTLQRLLMTVADGHIQLHAAWPALWTDSFTLQAPQETTIEGRVENGVLVQLKVTPASRRQDVRLPGYKPKGNLAFECAARLLSADGRRALPPSVNHVASYGVDGNPETGAQAGREMAWAYHVDLGPVTEIGRVGVAFHRDAFATSFRVVVSEDGKSWTTVMEEENHDGSAVDTTVEPVRARFLRVIAVKPDGSSPHEKGGQMRVTELEVYGSKSGQ